MYNNACVCVYVRTHVHLHACTRCSAWYVGIHNTRPHKSQAIIIISAYTTQATQNLSALTGGIGITWRYKLLICTNLLKELRWSNKSHYHSFVLCTAARMDLHAWRWQTLWNCSESESSGENRRSL